MAGHSRVLWEGTFWGGTEPRIIGYGEITYRRPGTDDVEWFIVGPAAQKNYISIYINATDEDGSLVKQHASRLGKVKVSNAAISLKRVDDVDLEALEELVTLARDQMT